MPSGPPVYSPATKSVTPASASRAELGIHSVFVSDDRHVRRARGTLAVEHGPVGRQLTVDGEDSGGPLPGAIGVAGDTDGEKAHDAGTRRSAASAAALITGTM